MIYGGCDIVQFGKRRRSHDKRRPHVVSRFTYRSIVPGINAQTMGIGQSRGTAGLPYRKRQQRRGIGDVFSQDKHGAGLCNVAQGRPGGRCPAECMDDFGCY